MLQGIWINNKHSEFKSLKQLGLIFLVHNREKLILFGLTDSDSGLSDKDFADRYYNNEKRIFNIINIR